MIYIYIYYFCMAETWNMSLFTNNVVNFNYERIALFWMPVANRRPLSLIGLLRLVTWTYKPISFQFQFILFFSYIKAHYIYGTWNDKKWPPRITLWIIHFRKYSSKYAIHFGIKSLYSNTIRHAKSGRAGIWCTPHYVYFIIQLTRSYILNST